jgi:hypothetical protein
MVFRARASLCPVRKPIQVAREAACEANPVFLDGMDCENLVAGEFAANGDCDQR